MEALLIESTQDELEWQQLEQERDSTRVFRMPQTGLNKPHPRSYRPDLPLQGYTLGELSKPTKHERELLARRQLTLLPLSTERMQDYRYADVVQPARELSEKKLTAYNISLAPGQAEAYETVRQEALNKYRTGRRR